LRNLVERKQLNVRELLEPHPFNSTFGVDLISYVRLREARFSSLAVKLSTAEEARGDQG